MRLRDKRAVITGAANGIGLATAALFAREGARVVLVDIDEKAGAEAAAAIREAGGRAEFVAADVTDRAAVAVLVTRAEASLGGIDAFVSNAGTSLTEDLLEIEPDRWEADLALNLTSHFDVARLVVPVMTCGGGGSLIFMSSVNALWSIGEFGYSAAKAGLISLTKNVAVTYGPQGVRANVICPGTIATASGAAYWDQKVGSRDKLTRWYPLRRLGTPDDVAFMALFLASDESSFVTGATMVVDGGLTAGCRLFGT